jgi:protein O-mannosyl-transferase
MEMSNPMQRNALPKEIPGAKRILSLLMLALSIFVVYWQSTGHDFVNFDDQYYVFENSRVRSGLSWSNLSWAFTTLTLANWHPLTWLSHMLDVQLFGLNPYGHHLMNICFHTVNSLLLFLLLWRSTGSWYRSIFVAALFGLHPLHVESVAWVSERKDLLSTLFMLIVMLLYSSHAQRPRLRTYLLALSAFAIGLMAKPMIMTLPFVLLLWDVWPLHRLARSRFNGKSFLACAPRSFMYLLGEKLPFFALSFLSLIITFYAQHHGGAVSSFTSVPPAFRIVNALVSYLKYIINTFWPQDLAVIYPLPQNLPLLPALGAGIVLLGITFCALFAARRAPYLITGWLWYLGTLVPVIGLIQVGGQSMADRYTYIPLIGLFVMAAWGVYSLAERFCLPLKAVQGAALLSLALFSLSSWKQIAYWQNGITLFQHAAMVVPGNHAAYRLLGNALAYRESLDAAARSYAAALRIRPDDEETYMDWGLNLARIKRFDEAAERMAVAVRLRPDWAPYRHDMGLVLVEMGRYDEAVAQYREAIRLSPGNLEAQYDLAMALAMKGDLEEAVTWLQRVLAATPDNAEAHYNLAIAMIKMGIRSEGTRHFSEALRIRPDMEEARRGLEAIKKANPSLPPPSR